MFVGMAAGMHTPGLDRSTICRPMAEDTFPPPVHLAWRDIAWHRIDLEQRNAGPTTVSR